MIFERTPGLSSADRERKLSALVEFIIEEPLKEWLRPKAKAMWSAWSHPDYVAIRVDENAPGYDYDILFDNGEYSTQAWGKPGIVSKGDRLHVIQDNYVVIHSRHLTEIDPTWLKKVRRCPAPADYL
ncbi:hypothetical protein [Nocardioides sp. URHA0020]|uniref:hypothetical protein n=1 Tax=Nocardioides sp. URHA0020 TaxID=1380392 RepID=UPI00048C8ECF|nr:hypothetical protein [Nocardioides sp. URHA0020]